MAADGAWAASSFESGAQPPLAEVRAVLARLETLPSVRAQNAELAAALRTLVARLELQAAREARIEAQLEAARTDLSVLRDAALVDPGPIRAILVAAAACAALAVTGAGVLVVSQPEAAPPMLAVVVERLPNLRLRTPPVSAERVIPPRAGSVAPATAVPRGGETYAAVMEAIRRGDANALPRLTGLAQAGDTEAQMHLASLYEGGQAGLPRDLAAARLWTRRAANGGHRVAMHNLGLFLMEGEGGLRDVAEAAGWFRRAADQGVVDSQYNLGLLYESGHGVPQNLREAYRWFSIAANAGDLTARERQVELEGRFSLAERAGLDRAAAAYRPGAPRAEPDPIVPPATTLAETQVLLARQGYYVGPVDGANSPQLKAAAAAWLRDHPGADQRP